MTTLAENLKNKQTAIAFASGFFGFFHHAGVLAALTGSGIYPRRITGTSAGAIVAGMYASGMEPDAICKSLLKIKRSDFQDLHFPFTPNGFSFLAGNKFMATLADILPVHSFEACKIPCSTGVYDLKQGRVHYINKGSLLKGICASCAVPYMFAPVTIDGRIYWDGGFAEKTPLAPLMDDDNIETVIISYLPPRETRQKDNKRGIGSFLPHPKTFFAHTPLQERIERDEVSVGILRERGKEVIILAPQRVWMGPFSLSRGARSMEQARTLTLQMLESGDSLLLGSQYLK